MILRRIAAGSILAGLALLAMPAVAPPASAIAHAELTASNPAKGASLDTPPKLVQLTFNEAVSPLSITVTGPAGTQWAVGQIVVQGATVSAPVQAVGPAGPYVVTYTVKSDDGDDVTGTVDFVMAVAAVAPTTTTTTTTTTMTTTTTTTAAPTTTAAAQPAAEDTGGVPVWLWVVLGLAILIALIVLILRRGRTPPGAAGAVLTASNPARGASLATPPELVQLTFNAAVSPLSIMVTGPAGTRWAVGQIVVQGATVSAPVQAVGPAGAYVVTYTVKSGTGEDVTGTVDFVMAVAAAAPAGTAPEATTPTDGPSDTTTQANNGTASPAPGTPEDGTPHPSDGPTKPDN